MPLAMQYWNIYRSHTVAFWLQSEGIPVIANVRWGDERTFSVCCCGVPKQSVIAVGSHGCVKLIQDREFFTKGLEHIVNELHPKTIIVYGTAPETIFGKYKSEGIAVLQFDSDYMAAHRKEVSD